MQNYDVIIIGGGLGGLTAGAKLAKEGNKILLLEQHYIPGGCATVFKKRFHYGSRASRNGWA
jgi:phytoene dehydrogenase-like protein